MLVHARDALHAAHTTQGSPHISWPLAAQQGRETPIPTSAYYHRTLQTYNAAVPHWSNKYGVPHTPHTSTAASRHTSPGGQLCCWESCMHNLLKTPGTKACIQPTPVITHLTQLTHITLAHATSPKVALGPGWLQFAKVRPQEA
jgi:hypothetical protein